MNKRFLKGGTPKVPQSKYNRNSAQGYSGESNCPTRVPDFQQERQVEGRDQTLTTPPGLHLLVERKPYSPPSPPSSHNRRDRPVPTVV